jgi:hypothetical protein
MYTPVQIVLIKFFRWVIKYGFWFFWCVVLALVGSKIFGYDFERIQGLGLFMAWVLLKAAIPVPQVISPKIVMRVPRAEDLEEKEEEK